MKIFFFSFKNCSWTIKSKYKAFLLTVAASVMCYFWFKRNKTLVAHLIIIRK